MTTVLLYFATCFTLTVLAFAFHLGQLSQLLVVLMGLAVFPIQKFIMKSPLSDLGFRRCSWKQLIDGAILPIGIIGVVALIDVSTDAVQIRSFTHLFNPFTGGMPISSLLELAGFLAVYAVILFAVEFATEEVIFRGFLLGTLLKHRERTALWTSAAVFALWHVPIAVMETGADPARTSVYILNMLLLGALFGFLYRESMSLIPVSLFHALWNALEYNLFGFADQQKIFIGASRVLFDPEEGVVGTAAMLLFLGWLYVIKKRPDSQSEPGVYPSKTAIETE